MTARRPRAFLAPLLALALPLPACQGADRVPEAATTAQVTAVLGTPLPAGATDVHAAQEQGMDRLVLLRFDAPAAEADAFARSLAGKAPMPGQDPGLGYLGKSLPWWTAEVPPGSSGVQADTAAGLTTKLLSAPLEGGRARVWVAAFSR